MTLRSLLVDSLGTTHIVWDIYTRPAKQPSDLGQDQHPSAVWTQQKEQSDPSVTSKL